MPDCRSGAGLSVRGGEEKPSDPRKESQRGVTARITSPSACAVHRIHLPSNTTLYSAEVSSQTKKEQKKYFLEKVRVRNHGGKRRRESREELRGRKRRGGRKEKEEEQRKRTEDSGERKRKKHGACELYVQNPQGIAANSFLFEENLQLGNRPFYDLFAVVIGCSWSCAGAARLHGLFPDFPGEFPPAFCLPGASPPLFLTFVSAEVGSSRRLRDCGVRRGLRSRPAPNVAPPPLRSGRAAAASGAGGEPGGRESPEGAPGAEAPAGADAARQEQLACSG